MNSGKNIRTYHQLRVVIETRPDEKLIAHLKRTVLGTPGGLRYRHTEQEKKLKHIGEAYFMLLFKNEFMLGSVGLCLRNTYIGIKTEKSWYIRYFAINAPLRAKKRHSGSRKLRPDAGVSILKNTALPYFENPDMLQQSDSKTSGKSIIFSYIEKDNPRAINFNEQMGFVPVRTLSTILFSRFNPKQFKFVKRIEEHQKPGVLNEIKKFYSGYTMFQDQHVFFENNYFLAYEDGKIVAGLQANPEEWQIVEMGGIGGFLIKVLPYIPVFKKMINPRKFSFLAIDAIWYRDGKAHLISDIIESVLADSQRHIAIIWQDEQSNVRKELQKTRKMGFLNRFFGTHSGEVRVKFIGFTDKDKQDYFKKPAYLSSFDMT